MRQITLFFLAGIFLNLQGCGSDVAAQPVERTDSIFGSTEFEILAEGSDPLSGYNASKQIRVIDNNVDFSLLWFDYTSEPQPEVDFETESVVIYDQGWIDGNTCSTYTRISDISAQVNDSNRITLVEVKLTRQCQNPDLVCATVIVDSRPFRILKLAKTRELFVGEEFLTPEC